MSNCTAVCRVRLTLSMHRSLLPNGVDVSFITNTVSQMLYENVLYCNTWRITRGQEDSDSFVCAVYARQMFIFTNSTYLSLLLKFQQLCLIHWDILKLFQVSPMYSKISVSYFCIIVPKIGLCVYIVLVRFNSTWKCNGFLSCCKSINVVEWALIHASLLCRTGSSDFCVLCMKLWLWWWSTGVRNTVN